MKLPDGWIWTPAEGQDTALTVGNTITVTATYTASDSVNYENLAVDVAITRSSCEHAKTERRGEIKQPVSLLAALENSGVSYVMKS
ncbi:MAG: hypothetical protein ACLTFZ_03410 [Lachnospiraceae bacterium]